MLEKTQIDGRPALVAYLTTDMEPIDKKKAEMIKITFMDGNHESVFAMLGDDQEEDDDEDEGESS
jgi:hypothetical protein